jgi:hypothetical protein
MAHAQTPAGARFGREGHHQRVDLGVRHTRAGWKSGDARVGCATAVGCS